MTITTCSYNSLFLMVNSFFDHAGIFIAKFMYSNPIFLALCSDVTLKVINAKKEILMKSDKRNTFEELQVQAGCSKQLSCLNSDFRNQFDINNKFAHDSLDCLECKPGICKFIERSELRIVCSCPLRNYIVKNFKGFIINSADKINLRNC